MELEKVAKRKAQRERKTPYRKWSQQEQSLLINFLSENRTIEKPTAQSYYRKFLEQHNLQIEWSLVRCKVRNMRQNYQKARSWQNSTGAGATEVGETAIDVVTRICPLFEELENIFGYRESSFDLDHLETEESSSTSSLLRSTVPSDPVENLPVEPPPDESFLEAESQQPSTSNVSRPTQPICPIEKPVRKGIYSRTALSEVLEVHANYVDAKKENFSMEMKIKEKEISIKEQQQSLEIEKFAFEKERHMQDVKLKESEIKSNERLKILELEMQKAVSLREIAMKERIEIEKLKMQS